MLKRRTMAAALGTMVLLMGAILCPVSLAAVAPPSGLTAADHPNDTGEAIDLTWALSPDDVSVNGVNKVASYEILRQEGSTGTPQAVGTVPATTTEFSDRNCKRGLTYIYQLVAVGSDGSRSSASALTQPIAPIQQWFDWSRLYFMFAMIVICGSVLMFIAMARSGMELKVRKIAGLSAVEDAVGRATEMGKPLLFVPGVQDLNDIMTVAGITILGRVAKVAAEHDASLVVPTSRSLVMTAARETVQASYLTAGRPDAYNEDKIYYVTDEQFGYVAALSGWMVREKPAACFYFGSFFAESLILAETGNSVGAIQVAGTAQPAQLPFFVAACDYTLIGEEFFAASAYLSGDREALGSLKGQDVGKMIVGALIVIGCFLATMKSINGPNSWAASKLDFLVTTVLK